MNDSIEAPALGENSRQKRTKEKILNKAMHMLAKNPAASLDEIAAASEIGRATLFRYFKSRKQLIRELVVEADRRLEEATRPILAQGWDSRQTLEKIIKVLVPLGASFHFLNSEQIQTDGLELENLYRNQFMRLQELTTRLRSEGVVSSAIPHAWVTAVLDNLLYTAWVTVSDGDIAPNDAPGLVLSSFLHGMAPV